MTRRSIRFPQLDRLANYEEWKDWHPPHERAYNIRRTKNAHSPVTPPLDAVYRADGLLPAPDEDC